MKITGSFDHRFVTSIYNRQLEQKQNEGARSAKQGDTIEISERGRMMQRYRDQLKKTPEVRVNLVESIKKSLEEDTYQSEPEKIAEGIIKEYRLDKSV